MVNSLWGIPVIKNKILVVYESVQKRKHRAKRINKKWLKRYGYKLLTKPDPKIYQLYDGKIFGHPETIDKWLKLIDCK